MIKTNKQWRQFLYGYEVPKEVLSGDYDYLSDDEKQDGFIKYKDSYYHVSEFTRTDIDGWHGIQHDSFFSGVVIKLSSDCELYQIGTFIN